MSAPLASVVATALVALVVALVVPDPAARLRALDRGPGPSSPGPPRRRRPWRRRSPSPDGGQVPVPVLADLVAAALVSGLPARSAVDVVADEVEAADGFAASLRTLDGGFAPIGEALELSARTGLAPGGLVQAAGDESRRRRTVARQVAARRLGTLVVLPTGLCLLPAFVLLTVVPLVLDLVLG